MMMHVFYLALSLLSFLFFFFFLLFMSACVEIDESELDERFDVLLIQDDDEVIW